jgi:hypothetical protein
MPPNGEVRLMRDAQHGAGTQVTQEPHHRRPRNRHAALRRLEARFSEMQEYGAAASSFGGTHVPVKNDTDIVKMVAARHPLATGGIGKTHRPIVVPIARRVAPAEVGRDGHQSERGWTNDAAAPPVVGPKHSHGAKRRLAVSLAFADGGAAAAQSARLDDAAKVQ